MFANIKAVIIDLDGTMLNTAPDFHAAINRMRAEFPLPPLPISSPPRPPLQGSPLVQVCAV